MSNTYAINTTRGKEWAVAEELDAIGHGAVKVWTPRQLVRKYIPKKKAYIWHERPYISKLLFATFPAIYFPDVNKLKHIHGKPMVLSRMDIKGSKGRNGLEGFQAGVAAEYADMQRKQANSEYQCEYKAGQALSILRGSFEGFSANFQSVFSGLDDDGVFLNVEIDIFGAKRTMRVAPDMVGVA